MSRLTDLNLRSETYERLMNNEFNCEKELTMSILSGKYKVVIIWHLGNEHPHRFGELRRLFKRISSRMLTKQLRELEQDSIVERTILPCDPPGVASGVEYSLTELGFTLLPVVNHIYRWGQENMAFYVRRLHEQNGTEPPEHIVSGTVMQAK